MKSVVLESLIPVNTKMGGPITTLFMPMSAEGFVLSDGEDYFLVDGGGGGDILRCMDQMKIPWERLHHAFLTHEHTDHILGMVWAVRYVTELILYGNYKGNFTVFSNAVAGQKLKDICMMLLKKAQRDLIGERIFIRFVEDGHTEVILGDLFTFFDIHSAKARRIAAPSPCHRAAACNTDSIRRGRKFTYYRVDCTCAY